MEKADEEIRKILPRPSHGVLPPSRPARHWDSTKSRRGDGALKAAPRGRPHPYATNTNTNTMKSVYNVYYTLRSFYCCESFSNNLEVFIQHKVTLQWTSIDTIEERSQNFQVQLKYNKYKSKNKLKPKRGLSLVFFTVMQRSTIEDEDTNTNIYCICVNFSLR